MSERGVLRATVSTVRRLLRPLALDIYPHSHTPIPVVTYVLLCALLAGYYYVYVWSVVWMVAVRCPRSGDLVGATIVFSLGVSSEIGAIKLYVMYIYRKKIRNITGEYLQCESELSEGRLKRSVDSSMASVRRRALLYWLVLVLDALAYDIAPAFLPGKHLSDDHFVIYGFEPIFESPNFELASTLMGVLVVFMCYTAGSVSAFLTVMAGYSEATMLALSDDVLHIWDEALAHRTLTAAASDGLQDEAECKILNQFIAIRLAEVVRIHTRQVRLMGEVEQVFRSALAGGFMCDVCALIAVLLGGLENTYLQLPFCVMQISVDCFVGQKLKDASCAFETAVYNSGGVKALDYTSLMAIFKSIYSAYTTLRPMVSKRS